MKNVLQINNNGPEVVETNFWNSQFSERGLFYLSANAGAFRLLVPEAQDGTLQEMHTAKEVVITRGWHDGDRREMVEIMFDDHTDDPFTLWLSLEQTDNRVAEGKPLGLPFYVYLRDCVIGARFMCYWRRAGLPCMKPLHAPMN
jgi:hypothetical protein